MLESSQETSKLSGDQYHSPERPPCFWENVDFWVEGHTANEKTPLFKSRKSHGRGVFLVNGTDDSF